MREDRRALQVPCSLSDRRGNLKAEIGGDKELSLLLLFDEGRDSL